MLLSLTKRRIIMTVKLYIDVGHGGTDPGAIGNGLKEKDLTLKIGFKIREMLKQYEGISVVMSRIGDATKSLATRTREANSIGADYFLSIHINSATKTSAHGWESFIFNDGHQVKSSAFQNVLHTEVMKIIAPEGVHDRGKKQANFHVLRETKMPAVLTENLFIVNPDEARKLKSDEFLNKLAQGHVNGLVKFLGLKKKGGATVPEQPKKETPKEMKNAIAKARAKKIMLGYNEKDFGEHDAVTRGQLAVVLDRLGLLD